MKRLAALLLAAVLSFSLAACQGQEAESSEMTASSAETQEQEETTETTESESGETEPAEGVEPESTEGMESEPAESGEPESNILIAYFTLGRNAEYGEDVDASASASLVPDGEELVGTTEYVARLIQECVGGDLHLIQVTEPYPADFDTVVDQNHEEMAAGTLPELADSDLDVSQYDTVFIGYPVWAANAPQAVFSFLSQYDLSGKTIIPFCTHNGYGAGSSYGDIADAVDGEAAVLDGLAIEATDVPQSAETVAGWLDSIGIEGMAGTSAQTEETAITITIGDTILDGVLYDTALADEISRYFPLTISMVDFSGREYYGGVDFYPENLEGGRTTFENGHITYCEAHHNMAIFYAQTDDPVLSVDVIPVGMVTSDLSVFEELPGNVDVTFNFAE